MTRRAVVLVTGVLALIVFAAGAFLYERPGNRVEVRPPVAVDEGTLVRFHSPIVGPRQAPVTIVEFFDPSCEACRAFYPIVNQILAEFPEDVRLVLRYAPLHEGSAEAVRIIEAARLQDKFEPVLEALLAGQPEWAVHGAPDLDKAWAFAGSAGLDLDRARHDAASPAVDRVLELDVADLDLNNVRQTPTFFVNGKPLVSFGPEQLYESVRQEVENARASSGAASP